MRGSSTGWPPIRLSLSGRSKLRRYADSGFGTFAARVCRMPNGAFCCCCARWLAFGFLHDDEFFTKANQFGPDRAGRRKQSWRPFRCLSPRRAAGLPRLGDSDRQHRLVVADRAPDRKPREGCDLSSSVVLHPDDACGSTVSLRTSWCALLGAPLTVNGVATNRL